MDLETRIRRRLDRRGDRELVREYQALSPVSHPDTPTDRGALLERLLDHFDPIWDQALPGNLYLHGPAGTGKSALVTTLVDHLTDVLPRSEPGIHTSTRAQTRSAPVVTYLDARTIGSEYAFYRSVLSALVDRSVPEHGVGTEHLRSQLFEQFEQGVTGVVVVLDHADELETPAAETVLETISRLPGPASWLAVGRHPPTEVGVGSRAGTTVAVEPYRQRMVAEILLDRVSQGLRYQGLSHQAASRIAAWADGNAHDALTVTLTAAQQAADDGKRSIPESVIEERIHAVPDQPVCLGRVLALPDTEQRVLHRLVALDADARSSVTSATEAITAGSTVDLSPGTVKRYLYELADDGVLERVQTVQMAGKGRPPSRLEPNFPSTAFALLYDLRS